MIDIIIPAILGPLTTKTLFGKPKNICWSPLKLEYIKMSKDITPWVANDTTTAIMIAKIIGSKLFVPKSILPDLLYQRKILMKLL